METSVIKAVTTAMPELKAHQIEAALKLMDEGNTIPFIARYRKEMTGTLDEVQLQGIQEQYHKTNELFERKQSVIKSIEEQGKLTAKLKTAILNAEDLPSVEDLYLPYKQKRRTKAQIAREHGLQPLANWLLSYPDEDLATRAAEFVNEDVETAEDALAGAHEILAEAISEMTSVRGWLRNYTVNHGEVHTALKKNGEEHDELKVYQQYYDFSSPVKEMTSYRTLAINRGEKEKVLRVSVVSDEQTVLNYLQFRLIGSHAENDATKFVEGAAADAYKRFLQPSIEREMRRPLTDAANEQAIKVFGENLYNLLMQAPIKGKVVLGFDPAYRTGCKLAVMDPNGKLLTTAVIYPHKPAPEKERALAEGQLIDLLNKYHVEMIAIGNGTASRESEQFVAAALKKMDR